MNKIQEKHLNRLEDIAKNNNAQLISKEWLGATKYHEFLINKETIRMLPSYLYKYGWPKDMEVHCRLKNGMVKGGKAHLAELERHAKSRGGKLLSKEWTGVFSHYEFSDILGNKFKATASSIKRGSWNNEISVSEECCRQAMNYIFNSEFKNTRKILTAQLANKNRPLELDGYNENLKIAFEYQGHPSHWDTNHKNFLVVTEKDNLKQQLCKQLKIHLVIIPKLNERRKWNYMNIINHVLKAIKNSSIPKQLYKDIDIKNFKIDLSKNNHCFKQLEEMRRIAIENKGKLISTEWLGNEEKHTFEFEDGRRFDIAPSKIKHRGWPKAPDYYFKQVLGQTKTKEEKLKELESIAIMNGGKLLSTEYVTLHDKLDFEFADGRKFQTIPDYLLKKGWPKNPDSYFRSVEGKSKRNSLTPEDRLKELAMIAQNNKGKLISNQWIGQRKEYIFQFKSGEQFKMLGENMLRQGWPQDKEKYLKRYRKI